MPGRKRDQRLDDAIIQTALAIIAEAGFPALTMEGVADRVGVPKSTVYKRWPNRIRLASGALATRIAEMSGTVPLDGSPRQVLTALLEQEVAFASGREGRAVARLVLERLDHLDGGTDEILQELQARRNRFRDAILAGHQQGVWTVEDPDLAVDLMMGAAWSPLLVGRTQPASAARAILRSVVGVD
jgi:AcrR family transcriptional regulator